MSEQRQQYRLDDPPIEVDGVWSAVYNISSGGMCVVSLDPLQVGWKRKFRLMNRKTGRGCTLVGQVMWTVPVSHELTRVGIQWVEVEPYVRHWLAEQLDTPADAVGPAVWATSADRSHSVQWL
jgi:hypothetical protein